MHDPPETTGLPAISPALPPRPPPPHHPPTHSGEVRDGASGSRRRLRSRYFTKITDLFGDVGRLRRKFSGYAPTRLLSMYWRFNFYFLVALGRYRGRPGPLRAVSGDFGVFAIHGTYYRSRRGPTGAAGLCQCRKWQIIAYTFWNAVDIRPTHPTPDHPGGIYV